MSRGTNETVYHTRKNAGKRRCDRLNRNCLNEAGNSAADIARATGQEFLLRGQWGGANLPPPAPQQQQQQMGEFEEARPAWEREGAGAAAAGGTGAVQYASVVAEGRLGWLVGKKGRIAKTTNK